MNATNNGYYYECDSGDSNNCSDGTYVELPSGHVFQNRTITEKVIYKCSTSVLNDKWERVSSTKGLTKCTKKRAHNWDRQILVPRMVEADEYLYPTKQDYDAFLYRNFPDVYECDDTVCANGTIITLPAGHVFKRNTINKQRRYKCVLSLGDDQWIDITDDCGDDCDDKPKQQQKQHTKKQCTFSDHSKLDLGAQVVVDCSTAPNKDPFIQDARTGKKCYKSCHEKAGKLVGFYSVKECENNSFSLISYTEAEKSVYSPKIPGYRRCVKNSKPVDPVKQKTCKEQRSTAEGKACCDAEERNEAKWDGKKCDCLDKNAEFKIENGKGICIEKFVEPEPNCTYSFKGTIECNGKEYSVDKKIDLTPEDCERFNEITNDYIKSVKQYADELCKGKSSDGYEEPIVNPGTSKVTPDYSGAEATLKKFFIDAEGDRSVWRNAEGKFNTTRLASDITAGVVFGTVCGVVTGVIIKKNQVKKGFEALHCTVGGQKVADWGDEFSVGLQR